MNFTVTMQLGSSQRHQRLVLVQFKGSAIKVPTLQETVYKAAGAEPEQLGALDRFAKKRKVG